MGCSGTDIVFTNKGFYKGEVRCRVKQRCVSIVQRRSARRHATYLDWKRCNLWFEENYFNYINKKILAETRELIGKFYYWRPCLMKNLIKYKHVVFFFLFVSFIRFFNVFFKMIFLKQRFHMSGSKQNFLYLSECLDYCQR